MGSTIMRIQEGAMLVLLVCVSIVNGWELSQTIKSFEQDASKQLQAEDQKSKEAEKHMLDTERKVMEMEKKLMEAEKRIQDTEQKLANSEAKVKETEQKMVDAEKNIKDTQEHGEKILQDSIAKTDISEKERGDLKAQNDELTKKVQQNEDQIKAAKDQLASLKQQMNL